MDNETIAIEGGAEMKKIRQYRINKITPEQERQRKKSEIKRETKTEIEE